MYKQKYFIENGDHNSNWLIDPDYFDNIAKYLSDLK